MHELGNSKCLVQTKIVPLENFLLRDVAVVPNFDLLLLAGRTVFKDTPLPEHSRAESQLKCQSNNLISLLTS